MSSCKTFNAKHLQCHCIVLERFCEPSPCIFDISFFQWTTVWKNRLRKLGTIALPVYFMVLNVDYGIQSSIIYVSQYCLMPLTFYPSVVILRGGGEMGIERVSPGFASSGWYSISRHRCCSMAHNVGAWERRMSEDCWWLRCACWGESGTWVGENRLEMKSKRRAGIKKRWQKQLRNGDLLQCIYVRQWTCGTDGREEKQREVEGHLDGQCQGNPEGD